MVCGILLVMGFLAWITFKTLWDIRLHRDDGRGSLIRLTVSGCEASELIEKIPDLLILDVRSEKEFSKGHIAGARLVDEMGLELDRLAREVPCLIYCAGGYKSRKVFGVMAKLGFKQLYNLDRGFIGWKLAGRDVETGLPA